MYSLEASILHPEVMCMTSLRTSPNNLHKFVSTTKLLLCFYALVSIIRSCMFIITPTFTGFMLHFILSLLYILLYIFFPMYVSLFPLFNGPPVPFLCFPRYPSMSPVPAHHHHAFLPCICTFPQRTYQVYHSHLGRQTFHS